MKPEILKKLEEIKEKHCIDTDLIVSCIEKQQSEIESLKSTRRELKDEINVLNANLEDYEKSFQYPKGFNDNIVVVGVLENLFENLDRIPVDKLEEFINQYVI